MVKILVVELDRGLHPGHIARALERCVTDGEVNAHCELVRLGVRQAWGDQLAGACGDCGADAGEHRIGCAERAAALDTATDEQTMAEIHAAAIASLAAAQALPRTAARDEQVVRPPAAADPLLNYLNEPPEPDWSDDTDAEVLSWVTAKLAAAIVDATDRAAALQTIRRLWRGQVAPQHRDLVDGAAEHLRLVLQQRRAS